MQEYSYGTEEESAGLLFYFKINLAYGPYYRIVEEEHWSITPIYFSTVVYRIGDKNEKQVKDILFLSRIRTAM